MPAIHTERTHSPGQRPCFAGRLLNQCQHFFGVCQRLACNVDTTQHAGDLFRALLAVKFTQLRVGRCIAADFTHLIMLIGLSCDLWLLALRSNYIEL